MVMPVSNETTYFQEMPTDQSMSPNAMSQLRKLGRSLEWNPKNIKGVIDWSVGISWK